MSRHRLRRKNARAPRGVAPRAVAPAPAVAVREATSVDRLAYTRTQAAEALGISRSTFNRRVLPLVEIVETPWGMQLIPADELERLIAERRRPARTRAQPSARGRRPAVPPELVRQIRNARAAGKSFARIASELNASRVPTAHGGVRWWPSTIRAVLQRTA